MTNIPLAKELRRLITAFRREPAHLLFETKTDWADGLNVVEVNRLAGQVILEERIEWDGKRITTRHLIVNASPEHDDGINQVTWRVWDRAIGHEGLNQEKLKDSLAYLEKWQAWAEGTAGQLASIWHHGGRSYSKNGVSPVQVSNEQHNILRQFLNRDEALDTKALVFGASNVANVIGKLEKRFGKAAIRRPKGKGDGYFISVRALEKLPTG